MKPTTFGKYTVIRSLGSGGMAAVYEAADELLERRVAIKVIHPHLAQESGFADRFRQEARLVAALRHPHIVRLYDFDIFNDQPFMVMEYLEGGTLKDRLAEQLRQGQLAELGLVAQNIISLAEGLDYAHTHGAVHRDIKPANILFTSQDEPVISDFGIVKLLHESMQISMTGGVIGTPAYMSPEQASGKSVDGRSDQYSLGIMAYEMVTGRVPFIGETATALLMKHLTEDPPAPRGLNPNLPLAAEAVLLRALHKDPSKRYPTLSQFAGSFDRALRGLDVDLEAEEPKPIVLEGATEVDSSLEIRAPEPAIKTVSTEFPSQAHGPTSPQTSQNSQVPLPELAAEGKGLVHETLATLRKIPRWGGLTAGAVFLLVVGMVIFLSLGGLSLFAPPPTSQSGGYTLAIADFDGSQASINVDFGRRIFDQLESELSDLGGQVNVVRLGETYTDAELAKAAGKKLGAAILIWGWYDDLGVSPSIEMLEPAPTPATPGSNIFLQTAKAAGLAEAGGPAQVDLGDFFKYLRVPRMVDELNLFVENGPEQVAYITEAVLALAYQSQGDLETALILYDKALSKVAPPTSDNGTGGKQASPGAELVYMQRAVGLAQSNRFIEAVQDLETARALNPQLPEVYYNLAVLYPQVCSPAVRLEDAIAAAKQAATLQPNEPANHTLLAGLYSQSGQIDLAIQAAQAAVERDSQDEDALLMLASLYAASGQDAPAQSQYDQAIEVLQEQQSNQDVETAASLIALGDATLQAGKLDEAREAFLQAQELQPDLPDVHRGLGSIALQNGRLEDAVREFKSWSELEPENSSAFTLLGLAYLKLEDEQKTRQSFETAASLSPCDPDPHLLLGGYYWEQGNYEQAEAEFSVAAKLEPYAASSSYLLGVTQLLQDRNVEAQSALSQAISLDPKMSSARYALGSLYYEKGEFAQARDEFQRVAQDDPEDASARVSLGNAYEKLGEIDQAIAAYQQALSIQEDPNVHAYLGLIYSQRGETETAIHEYQQAIDGDPGMYVAHAGLGDALAANGDLEGAVESYRKALALQDSPELRSQVALLLARLGNVEEAILELEAATVSASENSLLLNQLAGLYSRVGRLQDAQGTYQALVDLNGDDPVGYLGLGQVAYKRCDLSDMAKNYSQAATLGASQALYFSLPASAYAAQGDYEQQAEVMASLLEKYPDDMLAHLVAAEFYLGNGQLQEAEDLLQTALESSSLPPVFQSLAHYDQGVIQLERGNLTAAEGELQLALQGYPSNAAAQTLLGDIALRRGDGEAALSAYEQAGKLLPEYGVNISGDYAELFVPLLEARSYLATSLSGDSSEPQLALDLAQKIVERAPQWAQAHFTLGWVYYAIGQADQANTEFQAAAACDASLEQAATRAKAELDKLP